jgi:hypothetical protein
MSENPYAATTISPVEASWPSTHEGVVVITDTKMSKSVWRLTFDSQSVSLLNDEGVVCKTAEKAKFMKEFSFAPIGVRCLILKIDGKKRVIKLSEENVIEIIRLLGVDEWKQVYGKIGAKGMLGWGIVLLLISGMVIAGTKIWTTELIALEVLWISAGMIMITNGVLAKKNPRALNYALQMGSSGLIVVCVVIGMTSHFSYFQIFFMTILLVGIPIALQNYQLFKKFETTA